MRLSHKKIGLFFNLDNLFSTLLVIFILKFLPIIFYLDFLDPIQNTLENFQISDLVFSKIIEEEDIPADTNIVLVNISRLERREIAHLLQIVIDNKPKVIGIDALLDKPKDPSADSILANVIINGHNIVLVSKLENLNEETDKWERLVKAHYLFSDITCNGFANLVLDEDSTRTVRLFSPYEEVNNEIVNCFATEVVRIYDNQAYEYLLERGNDIEIINFKGYTDKFHKIDFMDFFDGERDFPSIEGKIVLLGYIGSRLNVLTNEDIFFTPLNDNYVGKSYPDMYGVVIWANVISMILDRNYYWRIPDWLSQVLIFLVLYKVMSIYTLIRIKLYSIYESFTLIWNFASIFLLALLIIFFFYVFRIDLHIEGIFFGLIISKQIYETWVDSLKLFLIDFVKRIKGQTLILGDD